MLNQWPTKANPTIYKFNSFWFELRQNASTIERETYSFLDWMGDTVACMEQSSSLPKALFNR